MQNKFNRYFLTVNIIIFLQTGFLLSPSFANSSSDQDKSKGKSNHVEKIFLTSQNTSVQSNAGASAASSSYKNISSVGQPGLVGYSSSSSYNNINGFIPTLVPIDVMAPAAPISITAGGTNPSPWQNTADFTINWTNPQDPSGIVRAYYKLGSAPIANFDTTGSISGIPPGTITATHESGQNLYLWLEDGRGNVDYSNHSTVVLNFDQSPPITNADSPDTSLTETFTVVWSGASDPGGSGLSGNYNVKVKDGSGGWTDWKTNFTGTSDAFNGIQGHTYYFEAAGIDNVGNTELFSGVAEDSTVVDTFAVDNQAPEGPVNITAGGSNPSPWQNNTTFEIDWTNPPDMSGIDRAYYKFNAAPTSNYDTTASISGQPPGNVIANREGGQNLFMWLVDGRGNVDFNNNSVVEMRYDVTLPTGTLAETPDTSATKTFVVRWNGADDAGGSGLNGRYDVKVKEGTGAWSDWKINFDGLSDNFTGVHGQKYYFEAAAWDSAGNIESFSGIPEDSTLVDTSVVDILAPAAPINLIAGGSSPSPWQNSSTFELDWTNPADISGIDYAYYKLNNAPTSNYDTTSSLPAQPPQNVIANIQGGQSIYIWLVDGSGNVDYNNNANVVLNFDQTKPQGSIASSPETSNILTFTVSWSNGSDAGGSGLSGNYDVNVKDGANSWASWKQNFNGTSDSFTGEQGHTYYFEAAARDFAGNIETIVGIPECSTAVDTSGDNTAPLPPNNLAANPSSWTNVNDFTLSWENPESDQTIAGAWYKIGSAPTNDNDGTFTTNKTQITGISAASAGQYDVYVWLQDIAGNHSYNNAQSTTIFFDDIGPGVTPNLTATYDIGTPIAVTASFSDIHSGFHNADIYYHRGGESSDTGPIAFVNDSVTIPQAFNTQRGLEYYIEATDSADNNTRYPSSGYNSIQIMLTGDGGTQLDNSGQPVPRPYGTSANSYRIFSVPFILNNNTPAAVLEDDLGAYDNTKWRFFDVQNGSLREYQNIKNLNLVNPGKGFLLIVSTSGKIIDAGSGRTPKITDYTQIPLNTGWNLIGNPFDFDIPFTNLSVGGAQPDAHYHGPNGWTTGGDLKKWEGLAIYSDAASTLTITPLSGSASAYKLSDRFVEDDWGIKVSAYGENSSDKNNYIGVFSEFDELKRNYWHEPPSMPNSISLAIKPVQNEFYKPTQNDNAKLSTSIHPSDEEGNYWDFEITGEKAAENIKIDLEYFAEIPEDFEKYLIDFNIKVPYNLNQQNNKITLKTNSDKKCEFRILVGKRDFVEANSNGLSLLPISFELRQNFPNPFNPSTRMVFSIPNEDNITLEVFNLLGQKIKTILNNKKFDMGYHTIEWDGRNDRGEFAASGMYIFRLKSANKTDIKKGILIR